MTSANSAVSSLAFLILSYSKHTKCYHILCATLPSFRILRNTVLVCSLSLIGYSLLRKYGPNSPCRSTQLERKLASSISGVLGFMPFLNIATQHPAHVDRAVHSSIEGKSRRDVWPLMRRRQCMNWLHRYGYACLLYALSLQPWVWKSHSLWSSFEPATSS